MSSSAFSACFGNEPSWLAQIVPGTNLDPHHEEVHQEPSDSYASDYDSDRSPKGQD